MLGRKKRTSKYILTAYFPYKHVELLQKTRPRENDSVKIYSFLKLHCQILSLQEGATLNMSAKETKSPSTLISQDEKKKTTQKTPPSPLESTGLMAKAWVSQFLKFTMNSTRISLLYILGLDLLLLF